MLELQSVLVLCFTLLLFGTAASIAGIVLVIKGIKAVGYGILATGITMTVVIIAFMLWAIADAARAGARR